MVLFLRILPLSSISFLLAACLHVHTCMRVGEQGKQPWRTASWGETAKVSWSETWGIFRERA